jgi:hypothetical protein
MWPSFDVMVEFDSRIQYPKPVAFESERLSILNRFRELILSPGVTEPQITSWLSNPAHQFILRMAIPAVQLSSQRVCAWQTEPNRPAIIPDFFATHANGFSDIVEFKLPTLKGETVVGTVNRERFSAEVSSYIAQSRVYKEYFNEKANRDYPRLLRNGVRSGISAKRSTLLHELHGLVGNRRGHGPRLRRGVDSGA